jgi:hypothetical protein
MTSETQSKNKAIVTLAQQLLDDIELNQLSAEFLLLKTMRLARLVDADEQTKWLSYELSGYPFADPTVIEFMERMGRGVDTSEQSAYREPLAQIEESIKALKLQMQGLRIPDVSYTSSNTNTILELEQSIISSPVDKVLDKSAYLRISIGQLYGIRSRVIAYIHEFVVTIYHQKLFSSLAENIFERYKSRIDVLIAKHAGDVLGKIPSIYNRLAEGDQEAISHAQTTCRRIIDAFADAVYPPTDKTIEGDGKHVSLNAANPRARINEYIKGQTSSKSRRTKLQQTLTNLYNRVSAGVHNDVTPEEAESLFLQTYLFLGEVLTLGELPTTVADSIS